jgi:hypothetical protein
MDHSRKLDTKFLIGGVVAVLFLCLTIAQAQQTSTTTSQTGQATTDETVRSGEVVMVSGNDLYVRMEDGTVKHFTVPPDSKFTVDGKEVSVDELTPGTKLTQTIKVTKTPKTVKTVTEIKGKVWHVTPPTTVILTFPDGTNKQYTIPKGQMFTVQGQQLDAFALRPGMNVDATVTREVPEEEVGETRAVTGTAPPPPAAAPPAEVAQAQPEPTPEPAPAPAAPAEPPAPAKLPQTATPLPLLGLLGMAAVVASVGLRKARMIR